MAFSWSTASRGPQLNPHLSIRYTPSGEDVSTGARLRSASTSRMSDQGDDMDVSGIGAAYGPLGIRSAGPIKPAADVKPGSPVAIPQDVVEISSAGRLLDQAVQSNPVREQRLEQIRAAIADGSYDTDEKLEQALNRMLASFDESA